MGAAIQNEDNGRERWRPGRGVRLGMCLLAFVFVVPLAVWQSKWGPLWGNWLVGAVVFLAASAVAGVWRGFVMRQLWAFLFLGATCVGAALCWRLVMGLWGMVLAGILAFTALQALEVAFDRGVRQTDPDIRTERKCLSALIALLGVGLVDSALGFGEMRSNALATSDGLLIPILLGASWVLLIVEYRLTWIRQAQRVDRNRHVEKHGESKEAE